MSLTVHTLHFTGIIDSKFERRLLSKILKKCEFSSSEITVKLTTIPKLLDVHKYDHHEPNYTLRADVMQTIGLMREDGYKVRAEVIIKC